MNNPSNKTIPLNVPLTYVEGISNTKDKIAEIGYPKHKIIIIIEVNFPKKTSLTNIFIFDYCKNKSISY
jgi:hypothetical protein